MATLRNVGLQFAINSSDVFVLGDVSDEAKNGGWLVQIVDLSSYSGTVTVEAQSWTNRVLGNTDAFVGIDYRGGNVNGTAADWSYVATGLTTNSLIFIPSGGMEIALSVAYTSGSAKVVAIPVLGSCAF